MRFYRDLDQTAASVQITKTNLLYYAGRFADPEASEGIILDQLARAALLRKLGASPAHIEVAEKENLVLSDLFACSRRMRRRRQNSAVMNTVQSMHYRELTWSFVVGLLEESGEVMPTPCWDKPFWGRLWDTDVLIYWAAGFAAGITFLHNDGWRSVLTAIVGGGVLALLRAAVNAARDRKRRRRIFLRDM